MKNTAVILLSGSGLRFGLSLPKQFINIKGSPLFSYSLKAFENNKLIDEIILVVNPSYISEVKKYLTEYEHLFTKTIKVIEGGETRQMSSFIGISIVDQNCKKLLIHDAVRPFIKQSIINECILKLDEFKAVSTVVPVSDTLYFTDSTDRINDIPDRKNYVRAQTPQGFHYETILNAHYLAKSDGINNASDDCYLINKYKLADIGMVNGDINNIKITYPVDIDIAEIILDKYYEI